jgi:hypothetical protein
MSDDGQPVTDEERRAFWERFEEETLASLTPFERYLRNNGLFDDVIRPETTPEDVVLEPVDLCIDLDCEECIGYWKSEGHVTYFSHECHKNPTVTEVPYKPLRLHELRKLPRDRAPGA